MYYAITEIVDQEFEVEETIFFCSQSCALRAVDDPDEVEEHLNLPAAATSHSMKCACGRLIVKGEPVEDEND